MSDAPTLEFVAGAGGAGLAVRTLGDGVPLLLLHGLFSNATVNWIRYGHAAHLASLGYRVIMPDLRGHGDSAKPHAPQAYPPDVLTDDAVAVVDGLGLHDYAIGGYSLGARVVARMLARGARPRHAVLCGTGLDGITHATSRGEHYRRVLTHLGTFERGSDAWLAEAFLRTNGGDPVALVHLLDSLVDTPTAMLRAVAVPVSVVVGADDAEADAARELAELLPHATFRVVPGNHMSAVTKADLGRAIGDVLEG